jgi:hypothetical protein
MRPAVAADAPPGRGWPAPETELEARLAGLADRLDLDRERRREVLDELRSHVLDAADTHAAGGLDERASLRRAWSDLGPEDHLAAAINAAHAGGAATDAVLTAGLPVLLALVLRWGVLTLDGRVVDWQRLAGTTPFAFFALGVLVVPVLVVPVLAVPRARVALAAWAALWLLSLLLLLPAAP